MDCGAFYRTVPVIKALPAAVKLERDRSLLPKFGSLATSRRIGRLCFQGVFKCDNLRSPVFVTSASANSRKPDYWSVATPLELRSSAGKFLSGILKNQRHIFPFAVVEQLEELAADKNGAIARKRNTVDSAESCLHGRIAEMKEQECEIAIEEVMYTLIVHKFAEIEAPMVPRLSTCIRNGKLETLASKDRQLESIHDLEVLEMVREHFTTILNQRGNSSIPYNWMTTQMTRLDLGRLYGASIMYGYFLKSACLRHHLEANLAQTDENLPLSCRVRLPLLEGCTHGSENVGLLDRPDTLPHLYRASMMRQHDNELRGFVMGFDAATLQRCAKLKSQEAVNLIEKHTWALFGDDDEIGAIDEVVAVTDSSLKRLVLEAVAFGSFLWDAEGYVDSLCRLKEN